MKTLILILTLLTACTANEQGIYLKKQLKKEKPLYVQGCGYSTRQVHYATNALVSIWPREKYDIIVIVDDTITFDTIRPHAINGYTFNLH